MTHKTMHTSPHRAECRCGSVYQSRAKQGQLGTCLGWRVAQRMMTTACFTHILDRCWLPWHQAMQNTRR